MTTESTESTETSEVSEDIKTYTEEAYLKVISEKDVLKNRLRELEGKMKKDPNVQKMLDDALLEKSKLIEELTNTQSKYSELEGTIKEGKISSALSTALDAAGAKSSSTVLKLIDKSEIQFDEKGDVILETVVKAVEAVQKSDPILFGDTKDPKSLESGLEQSMKTSFGIDVKRAGEGNAPTAYETEMKAAKSITELRAIALKYGIQI